MLGIADHPLVVRLLMLIFVFFIVGLTAIAIAPFVSR